MARKNPRRRLLAKQAKALHQALQARVTEPTAEFQPAAVHIRSGINKPVVGYQGVYRRPREVSEDSQGSSFYLKGGKLKPQRAAVKPARVVTLPVPLEPVDSGSLGRTVPLPETEV